MLNIEKQQKIDKISKEIEKQSHIVDKISEEVKRTSSVKLEVNDEWRIFEKTASLKKFVDEEIVLLNMRLKRMEIKTNER